MDGDYYMDDTCHFASSDACDFVPSSTVAFVTQCIVFTCSLGGTLCGVWASRSQNWPLVVPVSHVSHIYSSLVVFPRFTVSLRSHSLFCLNLILDAPSHPLSNCSVNVRNLRFLLQQPFTLITSFWISQGGVDYGAIKTTKLWCLGTIQVYLC